MTVRDYLASLIRTAVPILMGVVITWLAKKLGMDIPAEPATTAVTALVSAAYYALVRAAEAKWSWVGWLLGWAAKPSYEKPAA